MKRMNSTEQEAVLAVLRDYFDGLHHADVKTLRAIFHRDATLQAPSIRRSREQWLQLVDNRPVPMEEGAAYMYRVLSLEVIGDQAMAKLFCPLSGRCYIDFLGLLKENGQWCIVNKMYADCPVQLMNQ